jgi:uncharacterized protein
VTTKEILEKSEAFVRQELEGAEAGHDWWHIDRVRNLALHIGKAEVVDLFIVELGALLHDIADSKFHGGDELKGPEKAKQFLDSCNLAAGQVEHILKIIEHISYRKSLDGSNFSSPELAVIQDADRLDAIGAIGIARAFNYGGYKNRIFYDPAIPPEQHLNSASYKNSAAPTINHFYEKLLLLKDKLNTATGRVMAQQRHEFMEAYLEQFYKEWNGEL